MDGVNDLYQSAFIFGGLKWTDYPRHIPPLEIKYPFLYSGESRDRRNVDTTPTLKPYSFYLYNGTDCCFLLPSACLHPISLCRATTTTWKLSTSAAKLNSACIPRELGKIQLLTSPMLPNPQDRALQTLISLRNKKLTCSSKSK